MLGRVFNVILSVYLLSVVMLVGAKLNVNMVIIFMLNAECHYAERDYAECHCTECFYA